MNSLNNMVRYDNKYELGCALFAALIGILIFMSMITFSVYSVVAFTENTNNSIHDVCSESNLWYLLTIIITLGFVQTLTCLSSYVLRRYITRVILVMVIVSIHTVLIIWSVYELWVNRCAADNLTHNLVYKMVRTWIFIGMSILCVIFMATGYIVIEAYTKTKKMNNIFDDIGHSLLSNDEDIDFIEEV